MRRSLARVAVATSAQFIWMSRRRDEGNKVTQSGVTLTTRKTVCEQESVSMPEPCRSIELTTMISVHRAS